MAKDTKAIFVHNKLMSMKSLFVVAAAAINSTKKDQLQTSGLYGYDFFPSRALLLRFDRQQVRLFRFQGFSTTNKAKSMEFIAPQL